MKARYFLLLTGLLAACRPDETAVREKTPVTGRWRSTGTTRSFYTDGVLTDREAAGPSTPETYHFADDGTGVLRQGDDSFSVRGHWQYDAGRRRLTLRTPGGETLHWTVTAAGANRLVLLQVRQLSFPGHTGRFEAVTELVAQ